MFKKPYLSAALFLLISLTGCRNSNSTDREFIVQARISIEEAWLSENSDLIIQYYGNDIIVMPPNGGKIIGKEQNRNFLHGFFDNYNMTKLETVNREIIVSGDWAIETGTEAWTIVPETGGEEVSDIADFIRIWQRQPDDSWVETHVIWNSNNPAAGYE